MTKKKYYELLTEYQSIMNEKEWNPKFVDIVKFTDVKEQLLCTLKTIRYELEAELVSQVHTCHCAGIKDTLYLEELQDKIDNASSLYSKITCEEPIEEIDYRNTYYHKSIIGSILLTIAAVVAVLLICHYIS